MLNLVKILVTAQKFLVFGILGRKEREIFVKFGENSSNSSEVPYFHLYTPSRNPF